MKEEKPEEFAIHSLENIARLVKKRHSKAKVVAVLSEYDDKRFSREKAKNLCEYVDLLLINEEIKEFSTILTNIS